MKHRRPAALQSSFDLFYLSGLVVIHGTLFRLVWIHFDTALYCLPYWDFWLAGRDGFWSPLQMFQLSFVLLFFFTLLMLVTRWRHVRKSRLHLTGYGFVLAWIVSALVLLSTFYGLMIPSSWEGRLLPTLSRVVHVEFMPPETWDGETYIQYWPLGSCGPRDYARYSRWHAREEKERLLSRPKRNFFEEREWSAVGRKPEPLPPEGYEVVPIDGEPVEPERWRYNY